jgi:hypothetical protein
MSVECAKRCGIPWSRCYRAGIPKSCSSTIGSVASKPIASGWTRATSLFITDGFGEHFVEAPRFNPSTQ